MATVTINNGEIIVDYKPLVYNLNVSRGSTGVTLKNVDINVNSSYILGDNEQDINLLLDAQSSVDHVGYSDPVGLPLGFVPALLKITDPIVQDLGTNATIGSVALKDNVNSDLVLPFSTSISQNNTNVGFVIKITNLLTGLTNSFLSLGITIENADASTVISRTIKINFLNV